MKRTTLIFLFLNSYVTAQVVFYPASSSSITSARYSEEVSDPMVGTSSPAMLASMKGKQAALFTEKRFLTTEIDHLFFAFTANFHNNGIGVLYSHFGTPEYEENSYGICYGKKLGRIQVGISFKRFHVNIANSSRLSYVQVGLSTRIELTENLYGSIEISNPRFAIPVKSNRARLASKYAAGIGWQASSEVYAGLETLKAEGRSSDLVMVLNYQFSQNVAAGISWSTATNQPFLYSVWNFNRFSIQAGSCYHSSLGASPAVTIIYNKLKTST